MHAGCKTCLKAYGSPVKVEATDKPACSTAHSVAACVLSHQQGQVCRVSHSYSLTAPSVYEFVRTDFTCLPLVVEDSAKGSAPGFGASMYITVERRGHQLDANSTIFAVQNCSSFVAVGEALQRGFAWIPVLC